MDKMNLFEQVVEMTELPAEFAGGELEKLIRHTGLSTENLTADQLRKVAEALLQQVFSIQ